MKNSETTKQIGNLKNSGEIGDICKTLHWFNQEFKTMISHYSLVRSLKIFSIFVFQRNKTRQEKTIKRLLESFTHKTVNWYRKEILGGAWGRAWGESTYSVLHTNFIKWFLQLHYVGIGEYHYTYSSHQ